MTIQNQTKQQQQQQHQQKEFMIIIIFFPVDKVHIVSRHGLVTISAHAITQTLKT